MKTRPDASTKPYYKCLHCTRFRTECGGIPTRDMTLQEWCEYMRDVKDQFHLKNNYIIEAGDVSEKTVERIMALNFDQDIRRDTARRMEIAVFGSAGRHICALDHDAIAAMDLIEKLKAEVDYWRKENDRKAKIIDKLLD